MEVLNPQIPSIAPEEARLRVGHEFMVRSRFIVDYTASRQNMICKMALERKGNRPGFILRLWGTMAEFLTFGDGDNDWTVCRTGRGWIQAGQKYEVVAHRQGGTARIFINGIDHTHPGTGFASPGDLNNDEPVLIGCELEPTSDKDLRPIRLFHGEIELLGIYGWLKKPPRVVFPVNPYAMGLGAIKV